VAKIVNTYTNDAGQLVNVYESGAEYNTVEKRLVKPAEHTVITTQNATAYNRARQELKRAVIASAANAAVERDDYRMMHGDLAFVAAIAEAQYIKATTADDPKSTDAARFIFHETGISEAKQSETVHNTVNVIALPDDVAQAIADMRRLLAERDNAEEGKVNDE
jgi:hypothetical protein